MRRHRRPNQRLLWGEERNACSDTICTYICTKCMYGTRLWSTTCSEGSPGPVTDWLIWEWTEEQAVKVPDSIVFHVLLGFSPELRGHFKFNSFMTIPRSDAHSMGPQNALHYAPIMQRNIITKGHFDHTHTNTLHWSIDTHTHTVIWAISCKSHSFAACCYNHLLARGQSHSTTGTSHHAKPASPRIMEHSGKFHDQNGGGESNEGKRAHTANVLVLPHLSIVGRVLPWTRDESTLADCTSGESIKGKFRLSGWGWQDSTSIDVSTV